MSVGMHHGLGAITEADWQVLVSGEQLEQSKAYLGFREHVEPGDPVLFTVADDSGLRGAVHGAVTTSRTALFSHPWKMLAAGQFLRSDDGSGQVEGHVLARQRELLAAVAGADATDTAWAGITERLGEAFVVRGFDTSEVILRGGLSEAERRASIGSLLQRAQEAVRAGLAGAIALPYVRPGDTELKGLLSEYGFRSGVLTGVSLFDLSAAASYDEFVGALPKRRRRRYRNEQSQFAESGMVLSTVPPTEENLKLIVELEAGNSAKYGGSPDLRALLELRREMAARLGDAVRIPVVEHDGRIIACGIDLVGRNSYYALVYGCDYSVPDRGLAYPNLSFYSPIRFAAEHGIQHVRMGLEAFMPKLIRGARLDLRETWIWTPDRKALDSVGGLLDFLSSRSKTYFESMTADLD